MIKDMDLWIHDSAAGAAASAATVCTYYVIIGRAPRTLLYLHDTVHTVAAEAAAPAAAPTDLAAAPAADPWIHGSISFIMNHIFYFEMRNNRCCGCSGSPEGCCSHANFILKSLILHFKIKDMVHNKRCGS